ncbi:MAG: anti-sigma factor family protein [Candidatus Aminicenantia bacterium]
MKCKRAEKTLLRSFDKELNTESKKTLEEHLKSCTLCQEKEKEYKTIFHTLPKQEISEPLPYFWERLKAKLKEGERFEPFSIWKWWSIRVIPSSLTFILLLVLAMIFFLPAKKMEFSRSEVLLLTNVNPIGETEIFSDEVSSEEKNMMLIFYEEEENNTRVFK